MKLFCDYINDKQEARFQEHLAVCDDPQHKQSTIHIHRLLVDIFDTDRIKYPRWQYWIDSILIFLKLDGTNGKY